MITLPPRVAHSTGVRAGPQSAAADMLHGPVADNEFASERWYIEHGEIDWEMQPAPDGVGEVKVELGKGTFGAFDSWVCRVRAPWVAGGVGVDILRC